MDLDLVFQLEYECFQRKLANWLYEPLLALSIFQETNVFYWTYSDFQLRNEAIFSKSIKLTQLFCDKNDVYVFRQSSFVLIKQSGLRKHHLIIALKIILPFINFIWLIDGWALYLFSSRKQENIPENRKNVRDYSLSEF